MGVGFKPAPWPVLVTVAFDGWPRCVRPPWHPLIVESPFGHRHWIPSSQPTWLLLKDLVAVARNQPLAWSIIRHRPDISCGYSVHQHTTGRTLQGKVSRNVMFTGDCEDRRPGGSEGDHSAVRRVEAGGFPFSFVPCVGWWD